MARTVSTSSVLVGRREPRIGTPPLRPLTPETSRGFEVIEFARDVLGEALMPWQEEAVVRLLERDARGGYRFRTALVLVARQSGKSHLFRVLALWRMFIDGTPDGRPPLTLSVAQGLDIARETWQAGVTMAQSVPELAAEIATVRYANGEQCLTLTNGARWRISAATRGAGRGLSVDTLLVDELREQRDEDSWAALTPTTTARPDSLTIALSNAGDDSSVVLNNLRAAGVAGDDPTLCLLEWSAEDGCDLDDVEAWAQANPALGITVSEAVLRSRLATLTPARFRTEHLCQRVDTLDSAVSADAWAACEDETGTLDGFRDRVVAVLDVAPDGAHSSLVAAAVLDDGRVRLDVVAEWTSTQALRADLPDLLARVRPRVLGWFGGGPAAALAADLRAVRQAHEVKAGDIPAVCQGFAEQVSARRVLHPGDPMLTAQVLGSSRLAAGDGWRFSRRRGVGAVDAVYAAAGAVHLARTMPARRAVVWLPTGT